MNEVKPDNYFAAAFAHRVQHTHAADAIGALRAEKGLGISEQIIVKYNSVVSSSLDTGDDSGCKVEPTFNLLEDYFGYEWPEVYNEWLLRHTDITIILNLAPVVRLRAIDLVVIYTGQKILMDCKSLTERLFERPVEYIKPDSPLPKRRRRPRPTSSSIATVGV